MGILQEATFRVSEEICLLAETMIDDISAMPHGFEIPFSIIIMGLVIDEDEVPLTKGAWVDVGFVMGL